MDLYHNVPTLLLKAPLYLMEGHVPCYQCGKVAPVFCLGSSGFVEDEQVVSEFVHYSNLAWVPDALEELLRKHARGYYFDYVKQRASCYFVNHCRCKVKLSEHLVHNLPGQGFCPQSEADAAAITLHEIPELGDLKVAATPVIHDLDLISGGSRRCTLRG
jgi:hypothetical protein